MRCCHVLLGRGGGGDGLEQFGEFLSGLAGALLSSSTLGPQAREAKASRKATRVASMSASLWAREVNPAS